MADIAEVLDGLQWRATGAPFPLPYEALREKVAQLPLVLREQVATQWAEKLSESLRGDKTSRWAFGKFWQPPPLLCWVHHEALWQAIIDKIIPCSARTLSLMLQGLGRLPPAQQDLAYGHLLKIGRHIVHSYERHKAILTLAKAIPHSAAAARFDVNDRAGASSSKGSSEVWLQNFRCLLAMAQELPEGQRTVIFDQLSHMKYNHLDDAHVEAAAQALEAARRNRDGLQPAPPMPHLHRP